MAKKRVMVYINASGNVAVDQNTVTIKTKKKDKVVWRSDDGGIRIDFDKPEGSPFKKNWFTASSGKDTKPAAQAIVQPVPAQRFRYSVTLTPANGNPLPTLDPGVDVDGGGGPGPRKKSARKKAARKKTARKKVARRKAVRKTVRKRASRKGARKKASRKKK